MSRTTLLTGGTGIVGNAIAAELVRRGRRVRALVRSLERGRALLPAECELVQGDVTDAASVTSALDGCDVVYHAAGLPEQWLADPGTFARVNAGGTRIVADAARAAGVALQVNACGSVLTPFFTDRPVRDFASATSASTQHYSTFFRGMLTRGIYPPLSQFEAWFLSAAHTVRDVEQTIKAAKAAMKEVGRSLKDRPTQA